jgi:hypothetical protein
MKTDKVTKTKQKPRGAAALGAGPGRPKGLPNKATVEFKQAVTRLLDHGGPKMIEWLEAVARGNIEDGGKTEPDPAKALDLISKLAEYAAPKLARTEIAGDSNAPLTVVLRRYSE